MGHNGLLTTVTDEAIVSDDDTGVGSLVGALLLFLIVGAPMAAYIWHTLSEVLSGRIHAGPVLASLVLLGVFLLLLRALMGFIRRKAPGAAG